MLYIALSFKSEVCGDIHVWRWAPTRSSPLSLLHLFWVGCLTLVQIISKTSASISIFHECESNINKNGIRPHNLKINHFWQKQMFFSESPYPLERKQRTRIIQTCCHLKFGSKGPHDTQTDIMVQQELILRIVSPLAFFSPLTPLASSHLSLIHI